MSPQKTVDQSVAVALCDCRRELRQFLDFGRLTKKLRTLDGVKNVMACSDLCDPAGCARALGEVRRSRAARLVAGICSAKDVEDMVRRALSAKGLDPSLFWPVALREECALPHRKNKDAATAKALERLTAAVNRVRLAKPIAASRRRINRDVVVVGGGVAGLQAAATLARLGHPVALVHADAEPGGLARSAPEFCAYLTDEPADAAAAVADAVQNLVREARTNPKIRLVGQARVTAVAGDLGDFSVTVAGRGAEEVCRGGAVVLALGSGDRPALNAAAGRSRSPRIIDLHRLLDLIRAGEAPNRVAIVMDAQREQDRTITAQALAVAELLTRTCGARVKVFCHSVRVAALGLESLYRRVRDAGVVFVKSDQPVRLAAASDAVRVDYRDPLLAADVAEEFDAAVMADRQPRGTGAPAPVAELRSGPDGEAQYDNIWLLPSLTNRPGILVAGAARGNREYREALTDGMAAARQAHELLADGRLEVRDDAATVDSETCVFCLTCKRICPHGAIRVDLEARAACVSTVACRRCGACAAECPVKAITLPRYTDEETAADVGPAPKIVVFACENSAIPAAAAAVAQQAYPVEVELVRVPCAGQVDPRNVLAALESGARKVLVLGCHPESCQYLTGSTRATRRLERIGRMLEKAGFDRSRLAFGGIAAVEPKRFIEYVSAT